MRISNWITSAPKQLSATPHTSSFRETGHDRLPHYNTAPPPHYWLNLSSNYNKASVHISLDCVRCTGAVSQMNMPIDISFFFFFSLRSWFFLPFYNAGAHLIPSGGYNTLQLIFSPHTRIRTPPCNPTLETKTRILLILLFCPPFLCNRFIFSPLQLDSVTFLQEQMASTTKKGIHFGLPWSINFFPTFVIRFQFFFLKKRKKILRINQTSIKSYTRFLCIALTVVQKKKKRKKPQPRVVSNLNDV